MTNWKTYRLSDFIDINPKIKLDKGIIYPFVEMKDLSESQKNVRSKEKRELKGGSRFETGDTLFARITPCLENGKICQVTELEGKKGFGSTEFLVLRGKPDVSDTDFVFYLSRWDEVRSFAEQNMVGTSGRQRVSKDAFDNLELSVPPLPEQKAIASILSSLDDKIEINNKINKNLEALAQTIFKQWFIDFEFPNEKGEPYKSSGGKMVDSEMGEIPEGWDVKSLDEIAEYLNGLALQKYPAVDGANYLPVIKIRELRQGISSNTDKASKDVPEEYIIQDGDVLFAWSGTLMMDFWCNGAGALNQHLFKVTSEEYPKWFYYYWTSQHLNQFISIAAGKATTMGHIQRKHLTEAKVACPPINTLERMDSFFKPTIEEIINNRIMNRNLAILRDSLLPKLMSGELTVKQAEKEMTA